MRTIGIAELKATLSETLARVKSGEEVVVTEHSRPIAKISPLWVGSPATAHDDLVRSGVLRAPERKLDETFWSLPRGRDREATARWALVGEQTGELAEAAV
jgi:prevent-host-death family protein